MNSSEQLVRERLFALRDEKYRDFQCGLMPTVDPETVIGVRMPPLRALAKKLAGTDEAREFVTLLPHRYYEENNLHALLTESVREPCFAIAALDAFLPYVDNWATCDLIKQRAFKSCPKELECSVKRWISSAHTYTVRFGVGVLMDYYLGESFSDEWPALVAGVKSEEYYINMMRAWYFATALAKQYDAVLPYIEGRRLDVWTHNKSIQKAVESYRITDEQKAYLKTLRVKRNTPM